MKTWRLQVTRLAGERRFRTGHPWVYSNELTESPKGIEPGEQIELSRCRGQVSSSRLWQSELAHCSRVSRSLSRDPAIESPLAAEAIFNQLARAGGELRRMIGLGDFSHRLCFGEADEIPGLVIDRYRLKEWKRSGLCHSGASPPVSSARALPAVVEALQKYSGSEEKWN